jgi:hypothetical protein
MKSQDKLSGEAIKEKMDEFFEIASPEATASQSSPVYTPQSAKDAMDAFFGEHAPEMLVDSRTIPGVTEMRLHEDNLKCREANKYLYRPTCPDIATSLGKKGFIQRITMKERLGHWKRRFKKWLRSKLIEAPDLSND